ncbi:MAG TPA: hypothetical protein VE617_00030 [Propionibacteriaceae bacterium]|jgi:hypothetical protein|nr:hypothetical protein [Propionibacteriaceae bacterium]
MGIFDKAKDALGGSNDDEAIGQQHAERVEGLAGQGDTGTPPEDLGQPAPEGIDDPLTAGQSPADAVRSPIADNNP